MKLVDIAFIKIYSGGLSRAVMMVSRILMLITCTFLLTYTTSPIALTDGLEALMGPLKKVGVPVHELSMMMCIALRFIPTLIEETDKIMSAQKARGADLDSGNLVQRAKALVPIFIPLFVNTHVLSKQENEVTEKTKILLPNRQTYAIIIPTKE